MSATKDYILGENSYNICRRVRRCIVNAIHYYKYYTIVRLVPAQ